MAIEGVAVTPGSGRTIATDTVGGQDYQIVKHAFGPDGTATLVESGVGLPVDIVSLPGDVEADLDQIRDQIDLITPDIEEIRVDADAIRAAAEIMDDWDESNRAAVNLIASQVGVQGGSGAVSASTVRVTLATDIALPAGDNNIGNVDIVTLPGDVEADIDQMRDNSDIMAGWDNGASDGVSTSGDVAHDGVDAGEPVKVGYKAVAHGANPSAVAAADRTNAYANRHGIPFFIGGHPNPITKHLNVTDADGAQTDTALVSVSAGNKIVVTLVQVVADGANSGDVGFRLGFGAANTPSNDANSGMLSSHPGVKAGSGIVVGNGAGIVGVGADAEDLRLTCEDPAGGALDVSVTYFVIES